MKIANMWTKKYRELKTQKDDIAERYVDTKKQKKDRKLTAGDLAAVKIIETWIIKKRNA